MIDLSKLKAPGWQRVVEELTRPAPDDRVFLTRLLVVLGQVSGARRAVLIGVPTAAGSEEGGGGLEPEPRAMLAWPWGGSEAPAIGSEEAAAEAERDEQWSLMRSAAREAAPTGQARVFGLDGDDKYYGDSTSGGYVVAVPVKGTGGESAPGGVTPVVSLVMEHRSREALQTTLALIEVLAGYGHGHSARRELMRMRSANASLDLAARLVASVNSARSYKGAAMQVCNDLARQLGVDRVAMGWIRGREGASRGAKIVALSDTEHLDRRMAMLRSIENTMDECLDQEQAVMYPPPPDEGEGGDSLLAQAVTHAHRELASSDASLRVASVPLRIDDEVVGVLTIEAGGDAASRVRPELVELLQATMDLVAPVLRVRRSDDRNLALRTWDSTMRAGAWLVGPKHTAWKLVALAALALMVTITFVQLPYRIAAEAELQPRVKRVVSAPFDGVIDRVPDGIEKGAVVRAGQELATLRTTELELQIEKVLAELMRHERQADAAVTEGNMPRAEEAYAEARAARAQLDLLEYRLENAVVRAPVDGVIIDGEVRDRIGSSVSLGTGMFVVAPLEDVVALARVDDRDISYVIEEMTGSLARKSDPAERLPLVVERIVPLARPDEGGNTFEVRARLDVDALRERGLDVTTLRPGMEGLARFDTGDQTIVWILTRRIRDTVRLWLWY